MSKAADSLRSAISYVLLSAALLTGAAQALAAGACPTSADAIATDRPDVTNSSFVVPYGSLQAENGVDWAVSHGSNLLNGTNTRLRLGIANCTEFLIDVPNYLMSINGSRSSGFSDIVVSFKRQLPVPFGFDLSATAGLGLLSGSSKISGHGYVPYIQFPWSHEIVDGWKLSACSRSSGFQANQQAIRPLSRPFRWRGHSGLLPTCFSNTSETTTTKGRIKCLIQAPSGSSREHSSLIFTPASISTAVRSITTSASDIRSVSTGYLEDRLETHHDVVALRNALAVAFAVGLDVLRSLLASVSHGSLSMRVCD
jgi:hypothetical protein